MAVKKTSVLNIKYSQHIEKDVFIMHPNEGFDLGLMTKHHAVSWSTKVSAKDFLAGQQGASIPVNIDLRNECPHSQLHMNIHTGEAINLIDKAVLLFDGTRIYLHQV